MKGQAGELRAKGSPQCADRGGKVCRVAGTMKGIPGSLLWPEAV